MKVIVINICILVLIIACSKKEEGEFVHLMDKNRINSHEEGKVKKGELRVAAGGMITPKEGFAYYKKLADYIGKKLGRDVILVDRKGYSAINALLKSGEVDFAFICGGPYVDGHGEFGLELLAAPMVKGETVYYSYIIVNKNSQINKLEDLRGKKFAFTDPLSNTGYLVPYFMLKKIGETPDRFFGSYKYTYAHDKSIRAVAEGLIDGAAVDSLIWEYLNEIHPEITSNTKIIIRSEPYGIPPVVVRPGIDPELKKRLKEVFLKAHLDEEGKEILHGMMIDRFVEIEDSAYDSIRRMKETISTTKK